MAERELMQKRQKEVLRQRILTSFSPFLFFFPVAVGHITFLGMNLPYHPSALPLEVWYFHFRFRCSMYDVSSKVRIKPIYVRNPSAHQRSEELSKLPIVGTEPAQVSMPIELQIVVTNISHTLSLHWLYTNISKDATSISRAFDETIATTDLTT